MNFAKRWHEQWFRLWLVGLIAMPIGCVVVLRQLPGSEALLSAFLLHPIANSILFLAGYLVFAYMLFVFMRKEFQGK